MIRLTHRTLIVASAVCLSCSTALAGGPPPFVVEARAEATGPGDGDSSAVSTAAEPPATALVAAGSGSASASATFIELGVFEHNTVRGQLFTGTANANDTLTITAPTAPVGVTRLELTWRLTGDFDAAAGTTAQLEFFSAYALAGGITFPSILAGELILPDAGTGGIDLDVVFTFDNVPLDSGWNMRTGLEARSNGSSGLLDFADTAALTGYKFYVDNAPYTATIIGQSGAIYSVPEPASLVLMGLGGLTLLARRRNRDPE